MVPMRRFMLTLGLTLALAATAPGVQSQGGSGFEQCSDTLQLLLRNTDLAVRSDGRVHAQGSIFVQFQAIGDNADDIAYFGFSFGPAESPITDDSGVCDLPPQAWITGAYILNYRADVDQSDGFFINLQTDLVPDSFYAAAVHAYDEDNNELARAWVNAEVDNCDGGQLSRCEGEANKEQHLRQDKTMPWPILLPGDGEAPEGGGLTVEVAEELRSIQVFLNGVNITEELETWDGRLWDDDLIPGYGPYGLGNILVPECSRQPPQECNNIGEAYRWNQRELTPDDVVRVIATDMAGNVAKKEIHIGSGTTGAITGDLPNLQVTIDATDKDTNAGEPVTFTFEMTNTGGGQAHPFAEATGHPGWDFAWLPHDPVDSGAQVTQELTITPPVGTVVGRYPVSATITYPKGGGEEVLNWDLTVDVVTGATVDNTTTDDDNKSKSKGSPGVGAVAVVGLIGMAAVMARRRQ